MFSSIESVNILTALLIKRGVKHVVVCPGSRNAPIVHNFNECPAFVCHPVTDERSAGFVALGLAQHSDAPVAICVTSGSALLNLAPAVAEAAYQHYPIIVISADRPSCDIDRLQGQTIHQHDALAPYTSISVSLPDSQSLDLSPQSSVLINKALLALNNPDGRPVHINIPLPNTGLYDFSTPTLPDPTLIQYTKELNTLAPTIKNARTILLVLAQLHPFDSTPFHELFSRVSLLAEPLAAENLPYTITDAQLEELNSHETTAISPDLIIYLGGNTISKLLRQTLVRVSANCPVMMVNPAITLEDVTTHTTHLVQSEPLAFLRFLSDTITTSHAHPLYPTTSISQIANPTSQLIATFESLVNPDRDIIYYANSTAIRLAAIHARHYVFCNRGINGIEGSLSTAVGAALAEPDKTVYCVVGDLSFFYDQNALWLTSSLTPHPSTHNPQPSTHTPPPSTHTPPPSTLTLPPSTLNNLRILLLNSGGGEIFKSLPNATSSPAFPIIAAHHHTTAEHLCRQYNINYIPYTSNESIHQLINATSLTLLEYYCCLEGSTAHNSGR